MDSLITAAGRALAAGDPLGALKRVALRDDAPALALRGIALAQLGDLVRARQLFRSAATAFGAREFVARARCIVAEAEVALALRDLSWPEKQLDAARIILERRGDRVNAAYARYLQARRLLLIGRLDDAQEKLAGLGDGPFPPALSAARALAIAGIEIRRVRARSARAALASAENFARQAGIPGLCAEVEQAWAVLNTPAARVLQCGETRPVLLDEIEDVLASNTLVVDACRNVVRRSQTTIPLATRPVLFALARKLAENWPGDTSRDELLAGAFGARFTDESHRMRLRVEIGRLRKLLSPLAGIQATRRGFKLLPGDAARVLVLAQPVEDKNGSVLAFLSDGQAWSTSALAIALGSSQRTVQRALESLATAGKVECFGHARSRRWITAPVPGFTTVLLLPPALPID